jgi:5-methylcytosine-specific restriction endonuclease McrA
VPIAHAAQGAIQQHCDDCKAKLKAEAAAALRLTSKPSIICAECSVEVPVGWHGSGGWKYCKPCAFKRIRQIQKRVGAKRRALKRGAETEIFTHVEIFERDRWKCGICRKRISKRLKYPHPMSASLDHIIPLSKGGSHMRAGVQASHLTCNVKKHNLGGGEQLLLIG